MTDLAEQAEALHEVLGDLSAVTVQHIVALWRQHGQDADFGAIAVPAVTEIVTPYARGAALLTAQWYDELTQDDEYRAEPVVDLAPDRIAQTVKWALYAPGAATSLDRMAGSSKRMVLDASRDTVVRNAETQGVRWVRHAQPDACAFCRMLATRTGARDTYLSKESALRVVGRGAAMTLADRRARAAGRTRVARGRFAAGGRQTRGSRGLGESYHDHCRCVAVPVPAGDTYVPPAYVAKWEQQYIDASRAARTKGEYGAIDVKAVLAHMRKADGGDGVKRDISKASADTPARPTAPAARAAGPAPAAPPATAAGTGGPPANDPPPRAAAGQFDGDGDRDQLNMLSAAAWAQYAPSAEEAELIRQALLTPMGDRLRNTVDYDRFEAYDVAIRDGMRDLLYDADTRVVVRARTDALRNVLDDGRFISQYESNSSGGLLDPRRRAELESAWFGRPGPTDAARIYGAIEHPAMAPSFATAYGDASVYLKPHVKDRLTVTVGDSLDNRYRVFPAHPDNPADDQRYFADVYDFGQLELPGGRQANADRMKQAFIDHPADSSGDYIEAQIGGGVLLEDIDRIVFRSSPPAAIASKLSALGISWEVQ